MGQALEVAYQPHLLRDGRVARRRKMLKDQMSAPPFFLLVLCPRTKSEIF
jgi:hypothetical protein